MGMPHLCIHQLIDMLVVSIFDYPDQYCYEGLHTDFPFFLILLDVQRWNRWAFPYCVKELPDDIPK